jgi:predicted transcriptional regulator
MTIRVTDLADAELEVMSALWDRGPSTVRDLQEHLAAKGRQWAYTTVQTLLTRLEAKQFAATERGATPFVYKARVSRDKVRRSRVKTLVGQLYDGAPGALALHLLKTSRLSREDIAALQVLIDELDHDKQTE